LSRAWIEFGEPRQRIVQHDQVDHVRSYAQFIAEPGNRVRTAAFDARTPARMIDENLAHRASRERKQMCTIDRGRFRRAVQLEIHLMHQGRGVERCRTARSAALPARNTTQLLVDQREQRVGCGDRSTLSRACHVAH